MSVKALVCSRTRVLKTRTTSGTWRMTWKTTLGKPRSGTRGTRSPETGGELILRRGNGVRRASAGGADYRQSRLAAACLPSGRSAGTAPARCSTPWWAAPRRRRRRRPRTRRCRRRSSRLNETMSDRGAPALPGFRLRRERRGFPWRRRRDGATTDWTTSRPSKPRRRDDRGRTRILNRKSCDRYRLLKSCDRYRGCKDSCLCCLPR